MCTYRERVPFSSFTVSHRKEETKTDSPEILDSVVDDTIDLERLALALRKIKLRDVESNPGPKNCYLDR